MTTERDFFTVDATRTSADLRVNGNRDISHDQESEVMLLDQLAAKQTWPCEEPREVAL